MILKNFKSFPAPLIRKGLSINSKPFYRFFVTFRLRLIRPSGSSVLTTCRPNFIMVDFYVSGDVVRAVDSLNLLH